jgi:hypothetical protein
LARLTGSCLSRFCMTLAILIIRYDWFEQHELQCIYWLIERAFSCPQEDTGPRTAFYSHSKWIYYSFVGIIISFKTLHKTKHKRIRESILYVTREDLIL